LGRGAEAKRRVIKGIDFVPNEHAARYREAVRFIKGDPLSLRALVTTHKVNLLKASRDLFDELDPYAETLGEISSISKRRGRLRGHAKDPVTVGRALEAIVDEGYWRRTGGQLLILGSGGSSMALTLYLHTKAKAGRYVPARVVVTALDGNGLADIREVHSRIGIALPIDYAVTPEPTEADRLFDQVAPRLDGRERDRPWQGPPGVAPHGRRNLPTQWRRMGIQLSRKPRIPQTGEGGAGARTFARRGWLDLLHPRLDVCHRRGVRH
jgi:shikimate 5-dehydrogenase